MFRGTDGWDYESIADKLLERRAATQHNRQRVLNAAMSRMVDSIAGRVWAQEIWKTAARPSVFGRFLE